VQAARRTADEPDELAALCMSGKQHWPAPDNDEGLNALAFRKSIRPPELAPAFERV
jgi:hypothetical protein